MLDSTRLLFDLQYVSAIAQSISGCLDPETIARRVTEALVQQFSCVLARLWLVEPDQTALRLVASSGLYTHTNGSFARVPMGAYKVGKIAQNRVPFLSNQLAEESWVKDRDWAIANHIRGFAGYPLMAGNRTIGVLATFSHHTLAPEFLEVLQVLCMTATVALDGALQAQPSRSILPAPLLPASSPTLSDQLAAVLTTTRLMLVGTEIHLPSASVYAFLRAAEILNALQCNYCRLTYSAAWVALEAIVAVPPTDENARQGWMRSEFNELRFMASCLGGTLQTQINPSHPVIHCLLKLPYPSCLIGPPVRIYCSWMAVQLALTHLAYRAGLTVCDHSDAAAVLLTDNANWLRAVPQAIWVRSTATPLIPSEARAAIDLSIEPTHLRSIVEQVQQGDAVNFITPPTATGQKLSDREQEIMTLLAQGLRDREIAQRLYISESTVKFHINNSLTKLNAKNRYQAVYQAAIRGWI